MDAITVRVSCSLSCLLCIVQVTPLVKCSSPGKGVGNSICAVEFERIRPLCLHIDIFLHLS